MKKHLIILIIVSCFIPAFAHADITTSLNLYYKLDEGTGAIINDSAGTNNGATFDSPVWVTGKIGPYALQFTAASTQYAQSNSTISVGSAFTISAWVNPNSPGSYVRIAETAYDQAFYLGSNTSGNKFDFIIKNNGGSSLESCISLATFSNSTWYLVTGTYDGTNEKMYVNGVLQCTFAVTPPSTSKVLFISRYYQTASSYWNGNIDDVRYYTRALSQADVTELYAFTGAVSFNKFVVKAQRFIVNVGRRFIIK